MRIWNGILINCKSKMNNLLKIREKIKKAQRLNQAKLLATKNGEFVSYKRSVFAERIKKSQKDIANLDC